MSAREPTSEQLRAIEAGGPEILVEAGAGTGKTGVMVDRYCRLVCDGGVDLDSILAITFTDKAAAELRQRIRAEVGRRAAGGSRAAARLLPILGVAWVTTIHGFCNRVLVSHPVAAGVDPGFRVLDAAETERVAMEAFDDALATFLGSADREREATLAAYDVTGLRSIVVAVHAELRSRGAERPELPPPPMPAVEGALRRVREVAAVALEGAKPGSALQDQAGRALELLADPGRAPSLDEIVSLRTPSSARAATAYKEAVESAISAVAEAGEGGRAYAHVAELLRLFGERFALAKERRNGVDFDDMQLLAARLLERSDAGASYRERFSHILVDEFQDTNRLQLRLIEALRTRAQLVMVGDELQSIYGFRHADLDVFRERRRAIGGGGGEVLPLSGNFRSRPEVVGAVNAIGAGLLGERYSPLKVGAAPQDEAPAGGGPAVELLLTARDGWDDEDVDLQPATDARTPDNQLAEARFLAARLAELADRGVERGGMVVLLRAFTRLDAHEDSLERAGLRPYVVGGRGYWSQQQVADVCAILATVANPLDDKALLGALASPACGAAPDTLWLLRAAVGHGRHLFPALERACEAEGGDDVDPSPLEAIAAGERLLLARFHTTLADLRRRSARLTLPGLIEAAVVDTGYDLAVLMRPSGEARFANVRKLMRLAADFEAAEGRDLRGLLDFLAVRADADADAQAATAVEGHDGVRIMTIHSAKGLEFDVVGIPGLGRRLLRPAGPPPLTIGRELHDPRVGMRLRRLGARPVDMYAQTELCEEAQRREAEEELRLFHVAATRARRRLLLSGVVNPEPSKKDSHGTPVVERIVAGLGIDRDRDASVEVAGPQARAGLDASFGPSTIAVRVNRPSAERAAELARARRAPAPPREQVEGPAPLFERRPPRAPNRPLSYTAMAALGADPEAPLADSAALLTSASGEPVGEDGGTARGRAVHALLEWSQANGWREPPAEVLARVRRAAAEPGGDPVPEEAVLGPFRSWLGSELFSRRVREAPATRAEVPILAEVAGTVLRGSIDLLVEGPTPLIVDYKTDRLEGAEPAALAGRYALQRSIYALALAEARGLERLEVAYVFLERPEQPVVSALGEDEISAARQTVEEAVARARKAA